jgi:hypothetical protein
MTRPVLVLVSLSALYACGGQSVEPLDPRDHSLPRETRRWVADAEDGVIVARARRDAAAEDLEEVIAWEERVLDRADLGSAGGANMGDRLEGLMEARVELARLELEEREAAVDLAEAKYRLANAERAMLHDLAQYDLDPLRQATEDTRGVVREAREASRAQRQRVEAVTTEFWTSYSAYVAAGGDTRSFWIGEASRLEATEPEETPEPAASDEDSEDSDDDD